MAHRKAYLKWHILRSMSFLKFLLPSLLTKVKALRSFFIFQIFFSSKKHKCTNAVIYNAGFIEFAFSYSAPIVP